MFTTYFSYLKDSSLRKKIFLGLTICLSTSLLWFLFHAHHKNHRKEVVVSDGNKNVVEKGDQGKGFELFDSNTWIKGEKELQVLEMRALKGQLEQDLTRFDYIKKASVILDIPTTKGFGNPHHKTKASVILTLTPETILSLSQLKAITYHLSGAIRGLEPSMIAISDTAGKLYKAIDPNGGEEYFVDQNKALEKALEQKLNNFLIKLLGEAHFITSVQSPPIDGEKFSLSIIIDKSYEKLLPDIQSYIEEIILVNKVQYDLFLHTFCFKEEEKKSTGFISFGWSLFFLLLFSAMGVVIYLIFFRTREDLPLTGVKTQINIKKLANAIEAEDPKTIALMISYLEPKKAEQMLNAFSEHVQEKILFYLGEIEKEE